MMDDSDEREDAIDAGDKELSGVAGVLGFGGERMS